MNSRQEIFAMIGKVLGVVILIVCMTLCYFAFRVDFARIVNENTLVSRRKRNRTAKFDASFILVLTAMHFLTNSSNEKDDNTHADDDDDDKLVDVELASEHSNKMTDYQCCMNKLESFYERGYPVTRILVPEAGVRLEDSKKPRVVSGDCAICLNSYQPQDHVIWSTNQACPHVFHAQCMAKWTEKVSSTQEDGDNGGGMVSCPCCRQKFIDCTVEECAVEELQQQEQENPQQQQDVEEQIIREDQV